MWSQSASCLFHYIKWPRGGVAEAVTRAGITLTGQVSGSLGSHTAVPGVGLTEVTFPLPQLAEETRPVRSALKMKGNLAVKSTSVMQWKYSKQQFGIWDKTIYFFPLYISSFIQSLRSVKTNCSGKPVTPNKIKLWNAVREQKIWGQKKSGQQTWHWVTLGQAMSAGITWTLTPCALLCSLSRLEKQHKPTQNTPDELREQERKTSKEAEPSGLCLDRGLWGSTPVPQSEVAGKVGRSLFGQVGRTPEELPVAFLFMTILQSCLLLSPGLWPCSAQSHFISAEWNHSWFRSKDLTMCLEGRQDTQQKKNGGEKRNPEAAEMFRMPYLANRLQPGEASKKQRLWQSLCLRR